MKKLASILFAILISTVAFGQERGQSSPEERAKRYTDKLTEELDLTAEQQKKFYDMTLAESTANREMRAERMERANREANREAMQSRMKERQQKLEAILTPEQLSKYKALRSEQMKKKRDDFKRKPGMKKKKSLDVKKDSVL